MKPDHRLIEFARRMRHEPAPAEKLLWELLRGHRLSGFRFRRQHPIPPYIADFYCAVARLVVEVDGDSHADDEENDRVREAFLRSQGLRVLRFWNAEVFDESDTVLETIYRVCMDQTMTDPRFRTRVDEWGQFYPSPPAPLPGGERGGKREAGPAQF